ncbi:hypothetical protein FACS189468_1470 [Spirochaetia bacterium]|nr:hypothetical protein FACS189468_1470 [Spirochaetia bacterium]
MTKRVFKGATILTFTLTALGIGALVLLPKDFFSPKDKEVQQTRVVIPQAPGTNAVLQAGEFSYSRNSMDAANTKVALNEGETIITILTGDFDGDPQDEQIIAYRNLQEIDTPVFITYIDFDETLGGDSRIWSAPTAVTRPGTVTLYSEDLIGDGGICILVAGMNGAGEQTLTIFRKNGYSQFPDDGQRLPLYEPFSKVAEFLIEGSIAVQEAERPQSYKLGQSRGQSFAIAAYGRDYESSNFLDQVEITYTYNPVNGLYEQTKILRVPGSQIEQRRVRELLSGNSGQFEEFIDGLWYHEGSFEGKPEKRQYIYFDAANREVIFYIDDSQEVFVWQNSSATRYGLHILSRNTSLTNFRRTLNIELESLESIRLRVFEDVYLRIGPSAAWDGSYRKARADEALMQGKRVPPYLEAVYSGPAGRIAFSENGSYELYAAGIIQKGRYVFFGLGQDELLELRPLDPPGLTRETFRVSRSSAEGANEPFPAAELTLVRIRIGTKGIQELHEASFSFQLSGS